MEDNKMTYRPYPNSSLKTSLLGYGMMRLPAIGGGSPRDRADAEIDQDLVNKEVAYAIQHGVNYFDTAPVYCQGRCEQATREALRPFHVVNTTSHRNYPILTVSIGHVRSRSRCINRALSILELIISIPICSMVWEWVDLMSSCTVLWRMA